MLEDTPGKFWVTPPEAEAVEPPPGATEDPTPDGPLACGGLDAGFLAVGLGDWPSEF